MENLFGEISSLLIDENYRQMGCDAWNRPRFYRLCAKLQRTQREMGALLRLTKAELRNRLANGFTRQDGLLLTMIEREIDYIHSGNPPTRGIFMLAELKKKEPR